MSTKTIVTPEFPNGKSVELTAEEEVQLTADLAASKAVQDAEDEATAQKATDKTTGKQKLKDLGLNDDEIKALTGV